MKHPTVPARSLMLLEEDNCCLLTKLSIKVVIPAKARIHEARSGCPFGRFSKLAASRYFRCFVFTGMTVVSRFNLTILIFVNRVILMRTNFKSLKLLLAACMIAAILINVNVALAQENNAPEKASVNGTYSTLLRVIRAPNDQKIFGEFYEYGYSAEPEYAGTKDIPPGYWVYVAPNWYVWQDSKKLDVTAQSEKVDPFTDLIGKKVTLSIRGKTFTGEITQNYEGYIVLETKSSPKTLLINKTNIDFVEWKK